MKENKYDNDSFFEKYSQMHRSIKGLESAGEWYALKSMLPDFKGKRVLDLGCGFGWHCNYAAEQGAASVTGVDISRKMLAVARAKTKSNMTYICTSIEDYEYPEEYFDIVISSLAFHYIKPFGDICAKINHCLTLGGNFIFSVEHPVFTAQHRADRNGYGTNPATFFIGRLTGIMTRERELQDFSTRILSNTTEL
jgi:SAM-dependent methyltransferase